MILNETGKENYLYYPFPRPQGDANLFSRGKASYHDKNSGTRHEEAIGRIIAEFNGTLVESSFTLYHMRDIF